MLLSLLRRTRNKMQVWCSNTIELFTVRTPLLRDMVQQWARNGFKIFNRKKKRIGLPWMPNTPWKQRRSGSRRKDPSVQSVGYLKQCVCVLRCPLWTFISLIVFTSTFTTKVRNQLFFIFSIYLEYGRSTNTGIALYQAFPGNTEIIVCGDEEAEKKIKTLKPEESFVLFPSATSFTVCQVSSFLVFLGSCFWPLLVGRLLATHPRN